MAKKKTKAEPELGRHVLVAVGKIEVSKRPNREHIDKKSDEFKELVASVKATGGILQPLLVRPHAKRKDAYELVAGERRLSATKAAGRATIPCMVRRMTDTQAAAFQLTENVHRKDLKPLEEAAQIRAMLDAGFVTKEIAKLLGRTPRFVQRRASLTGLSGRWLNAASARDCDFGLWPAAALEKIARLPEDLQDRLFIDWSQNWRGRDLKTAVPDPDDIDKAIGDVTHELKRARWKLGDGTLAPKAGACSECHKRAGQQPLLWNALEDLDLADPKAQKQDVCLETKCWEGKLAAFLKRKEKELREKHGDVVPLKDGYFPERPDAVYHYNVAKAKKTDKKAKPGLMLNGPSAGTVRWVKAPRSGAAPRGMSKGPSPLKERRKKLKDRREAWVIYQVKEELRNSTRFDELMLPPDADADVILLRLVAVFGTMDNGGNFKMYAKVRRDSHEGLREEIWDYIKANIPCSTLDSAKAAAAFITLDFDALLEKVKTEIPEPKSWAKLKEDGTPNSAATRAKERKAKEKAAPPKVKRANFMPAAGNVQVNAFAVITHGFESLSIPIRKTARGSLTIEVAKYIDRGKDRWYVAAVAEFHPGSSISPISTSHPGYATREAAILAVLEDHATTPRCGEPGSQAAVKRGKMRQEDIKAFLEAAKQDPTYLHPLDPNNPEPKDGPSPLVCRGCGCSEGNACETDSGPCHWAIPPGTPLAKEKGPLCSACDGAQPEKRKKGA